MALLRKKGVVENDREPVWLMVGFLPGTMAVCHSSFIIEIGVYLLHARVECFCFLSDY